MGVRAVAAGGREAEPAEAVRTRPGWTEGRPSRRWPSGRAGRKELKAGGVG